MPQDLFAMQITFTKIKRNTIKLKKNITFDFVMFQSCHIIWTCYLYISVRNRKYGPCKSTLKKDKRSPQEVRNPKAQKTANFI